LFLVAPVVVVVGAIASPRANQRSMGLNTAPPGTIIVVTNTNDSGPGSLRDALAMANDGDTIDFDPSLNGQTITLTSGQLVVDKSVTISGPGPNHLAVDGNANDRIFAITPGETVIISGLTITNGNGGGILNNDATLTVTNCTISGNMSDSFGGGIDSLGNLTVTNTTISGNAGRSIGGGISSFGETTVTNSTISGNSVITGSYVGEGGGIGHFPFQGGQPLTVTNSTISGNSADTLGGGIWNYGATMTVTNSTISANSAPTGGDIMIDAQGAANIGDTILNAGASGGTIFLNNASTVSSLGYNLASDNGGGVLIGPGDQINTDPMLGPLQDNGGPTFTHALLPGSPAINTGDPNFTPPPDFDQRGSGFPRIVDGRIDKGSFEVQVQVTPTPTPTPTATATATATPTSTATATATPTSTPRPSVTPRPSQSPRPRPTPAPRP
jgi:hypothetical protein